MSKGQSVLEGEELLVREKGRKREPGKAREAELGHSSNWGGQGRPLGGGDL